MRLVCISDTHGLQGSLIVPGGDVLVVAGDCTDHGTLPELKSFDRWLGLQPHRHRVVVAGNHDRALLGRRKLINATVLRSTETFVIDGVRFGGTPTLTSALARHLDVLVTHSQPAPELLVRKPPRVVVYGHNRRGRWSNKDLIRALVPGWAGTAGRYACPALRRFGYVRQPSGLYSSAYAYASVTKSDNRTSRLARPPVVIDIDGENPISIDGTRLLLLGRQGSGPRKIGGYETCVPAYEVCALRARTGRWSAIDRASIGGLAPILVSKAPPQPPPSLADLIDVSAVLQCESQKDDTRFDQSDDYRLRSTLSTRYFRPSVLTTRPACRHHPLRGRGIFFGIDFDSETDPETDLEAESGMLAGPRSTLYGADWSEDATVG